MIHVQFYTLTIILSILWLFFSPTYQQNQTKFCNVTLFYETLCMGSRMFTTEQVPKAYKALGNSLIFTPIPFGSAQITKNNGKWNMTCQHGPQECKGNEIQTCAINAYSTLGEIINFTSRFMRQSPPFDNYSQYLTSGDEGKQKKFADCMNSDERYQLLDNYRNITEKAQPSGFPYILINGKDMSEAASTDLEKACCTVMKNEMPAQCKRDCDKNATAS